MTYPLDPAAAPPATHRIDRSLTGPEHDLPRQAGEPERYVILCTTPRSGSHRLGRGLFNLGLGCPDEYFHPSVVTDLSQRWKTPDAFASQAALRTYWQQVCARRQQGGSVATSLFAYQIKHLNALDLPQDRCVYIHLHRRKLGQQVASLMTLYRTKRPFDGDEEVSFIPDISEISSRAIRILGQWLKMQNRRWQAFLADKPHVSIASEDFFQRPDMVIPRLLESCGIDAPPAVVSAVMADLAKAEAYHTDADEKRRLLRDFAADFERLDVEGAYAV